MSEQIPDAKARAARIALAVLSGAIATALVGGGLWLALRPKPASPPQQSFEPAEPSESSTSTLPPGSGSSETSSPAATDTASGGERPSGSQTPPRKPRVGRVAFRLGASVYVAREDGSSAVAIIRSADGPYALSPDAKSLAVVDKGQILIADVSTKNARNAGPAHEGVSPVWSADSKRLYFGRSTDSAGFEIWQIAAGDAEAALVSPGSQAAVSRDGKILVIGGGSDPMPDGSSFIRVSIEGRPLAPVQVNGGAVTAVATNGDRIFVGLSDGVRGSSVVSLKPDGRDQRSIAGIVPGDAPAVWGRMCVSPGGRRLGLAAMGDDGYSRAYSVLAEGGELVSLSQRRDTSLRGWNAAGDRMFLIEGNAFQGESTQLVSIKPDGTSRRVLVTGAK